MLDRPLELPRTLPELATRAMQRFRCVGSACEDSCCRHFGIDIDRASLDRLRAAAREPAEREKVVRLVVLGLRPPGGDAAPNLVQLDQDGACPMLEGDGACGVHRRHGEAALSTTCSVFPRTSLAVGPNLEVTGSLACPELARLSLLSDDGLEQDAPITAVLPRAYVGKSVDVERDGSLYASMFGRVRAALIDLFRHQQHSVGTRFAFAATLAAEVDAFFRRDLPALGPAEALLGRRRVEVELVAAGGSDNQATLSADLATLPESPPAVVAAAASLLSARLRLTHPPRFGALVHSALATLEAAPVAEDPTDGDAVPALPHPDRAAAILRQRRATIEALAPGLMDRILGRFARHYLLRNPYTDQPSLLVYLHRLGVDLAALRLLWLCSPRLAAFLSPSTGTPGAEEAAVVARAVSAAGIEVIQSYVKAVSHNVAFVQAVHEGDEQPGRVRFGALVLMARFI